MTCTFMSTICFSILLISCFTPSICRKNNDAKTIRTHIGASLPGAHCGHIAHIIIIGFMSFSKLVSTLIRKSYLLDVSFSLSNLLSIHIAYSFFIGFGAFSMSSVVPGILGSSHVEMVCAWSWLR